MKKLFAFIMSVVMVYMVSTAFLSTSNKVYAESESDNADVKGWFVTVSITIDGGNGQVYTTARHDFSIFDSTVIVYLYLYCSDTYQESYTNMTLVASNYTSDLDLGETLTASCSTNNQQKYWFGRMYYKIDNNSWQEKSTGCALFSADGTFISA